MIKTAISLLLAFAIGAGTRYTGIPVPAPPALIGALLVLAMTLGFMAADKILEKQAVDKVEPKGDEA